MFLALLATVSIILSYVESLLPPLWAAVPGIKLGLPNIIILSVLYSFGLGDAAMVSLVRITVAALLFGKPLTLAYSAAGAVLSLLMMALFKRLNLFSAVGVSVVGGIAHNLGQILLAMVILETVGSSVGPTVRLSKLYNFPENKPEILGSTPT